jgi:hypothetical protein
VSGEWKRAVAAGLVAVLVTTVYVIINPDMPRWASTMFGALLFWIVFWSGPHR